MGSAGGEEHHRARASTSRGGSLPLDLEGTPYALCAYHVVTREHTGLKTYRAWLGFITQAYPHAVVAAWPLDTSYLLDLHPVLLDRPYKRCESVFFPMALRRLCGGFEVITGVQDGLTYGLVVDGTEIAARVGALREMRPQYSDSGEQSLAGDYSSGE